jgi:hypothetical protein
MKKRALRKRYGRARNLELERYRGGVEIALVPHFERLGVSYWNARDAALATVTKTHATTVRECFKAQVHPLDCAAKIERALAVRRAARGEE